MIQRIGGELSFFYGLHLNSAATPQRNGKDHFLGLVFTSKNRLLTYSHAAPSKIKVKNSALLPKKVEHHNSKQ